MSFFSKKKRLAALKEAYKKGYRDGCIDGYKNAEEAAATWISIVRRDAARKAQDKMGEEIRIREDKAYADGLRDAKLLGGLDS